MGNLDTRLSRLEAQSGHADASTIIAVYYTEAGAAPPPGMLPARVYYVSADGQHSTELPPGVDPTQIKTYVDIDPEGV